jgi:3-hydroxyacyl-CoA dehydrogenase
MSANIHRVAVIGGGTMGSGIAAHLSNLGFDVRLVSLTRDEAMAGLERIRSANPPGFMTHKSFSAVKTGGVGTHPELVAEADWVCEAIVEKLEPKKALYAELELLAPNAQFITTNTSGLPLQDLAEGRSESFKSRFLGTHFFNPARYLKLLELIPGPSSSKETLQNITAFLEEKVGRRVILAKDTPGFIANRYGIFVLLQAAHLTEQLQLRTEQVDAIANVVLGRPRTGVFRLLDLIGLDVVSDIAQNLQTRLDEEPGTFALSSSFEKLLANGWIGDKTGHGYYRREARDVFTLDLGTHAYRVRQEPELESLTAIAALPLVDRIRAALNLRDEVGEFVRGHLVPILSYAEAIRADVSHTALDFDRVMEWGFGWEMGPFRLIDGLGLGNGSAGHRFYSPNPIEPRETLSDSGHKVAVPAEPEYRPLNDYPVVEQKEALTIRDFGHGIHGLVVTTKQGVITPQLVADLDSALAAKPEGRYVLTSAAKNFSVGYDLRYFLNQMEAKAFEEIDAELAKLHRLGERLELTRIVAAVFGYTLGAGYELAISCPLLLADAETKIGLPEAKVGLIPGGRGTVITRIMASGSAKELSEAAASLVLGVTTKSAPEAEIQFLRPTDQISFHPDRLLQEAIQLAKTIEPVERPAWTTPEGPVPGMIDRALLEAKKSPDWSAYDATIADKVKAVFTRPTNYEEALLRERAEFVDLCSKALTQARVRHMVETGKPLRN